jgi:hypothetical protein
MSVVGELRTLAQRAATGRDRSKTDHRKSRVQTTLAQLRYLIQVEPPVIEQLGWQLLFWGRNPRTVMVLPMV